MTDHWVSPDQPRDSWGNWDQRAKIYEENQAQEKEGRNMFSTKDETLEFQIPTRYFMLWDCALRWQVHLWRKDGGQKEL